MVSSFSKFNKNQNTGSGFYELAEARKVLFLTPRSRISVLEQYNTVLASRNKHK